MNSKITAAKTITLQMRQIDDQVVTVSLSPRNAALLQRTLLALMGPTEADGAEELVNEPDGQCQLYRQSAEDPSVSYPSW